MTQNTAKQAACEGTKTAKCLCFCIKQNREYHFFSKLRAIIFSIQIKALYLQTENDKSTNIKHKLKNQSYD